MTKAGAKLDWGDLILPAGARAQLEQIVAARRRPRTGTRLLLSGASGTGKTMAAQIVARALGAQLVRIDLARIVGKYIGETEKNLGAIFDSAEASGAILFFDEADALFGKRSGVKDSHDRYANLETSYLLQRIEGFPGLIIFATSREQDIDPAFIRRLSAIVHLRA